MLQDFSASLSFVMQPLQIQTTDAGSNERVLYDGPPQLPLRQLVTDIVLCFLVVGLFSLAWHLFINGKRRFLVTTNSIRYEHGWINRKIELLDLFKVRDLEFASTFGRGVITVHSHDTTHPILKVPIADAQRVFDELQRAVPLARQRSGLALRQDY